MQASNPERTRRASRGCVFRPVVTRTRNGKKVRRRSGFYWAKYRGLDGRVVRHALKLPNGQGIRDKSVAQTELQQLLNRLEREAAGLTDKFTDAASTPMRTVLAGFLRHLRRKRRGRQYIREVRTYVKWVIDKTEMRRLADFSADRLDRALGMLADADRAPRTINAYRGVCHALGAWAVKVGRIIERNPAAVIPLRDTAADIRKRRRALLPEEAYRLLEACGPRRLFYTVQMWTGLRVSETTALEWRDLRLDGDAPFIKLRAGTTKAKRADEIDLHLEVAAALCNAKPPFARPTDRVFKTTPTLKTFKRDLERAGIPFEDDEGRTVDRHALRTTFVSWLGGAGVDLRVAQRLARHTDPKLTAGTYQDVRLLDTRSAVAKLPSLQNETDGEQRRATGTDNATPEGVVLRVVPTSGFDGPHVSSGGKKHGDKGGPADRKEPERKACPQRMLDNERQRATRPDTRPEKLEPMGFEPTTSWLQTRRSPN